MKYLLEFKHFDLPKTPNQLLGAHWRVRAGHSKKWERIVWRYVWPIKPHEPLKAARLVFIRASSHPLDPDNLPGSFKAVQDALVKCGIILDDTHAVIGSPQYLHMIAPPKRGYIKVTIESLEV
jgi:hypothetical protein